MVEAIGSVVAFLLVVAALPAPVVAALPAPVVAALPARVVAALLTRVADAELDRLTCALAVVMGIESTLVLRDICGLGSDEILGVQRWAARALVRSVEPN